MIKFILAPSAALANTVTADVTIEAEYGSVVAKGNLYTAAHHQPAGTEFAGRHIGGTMPSPCNDTEIPLLDDGVVLVSHVDLDTFGGCLRTLSECAELFSAEYQGFWDLAEFVDTNGPHKIGQIEVSVKDVRRLNAFWAWSKSNPRFSRDSITDITAMVLSAGSALLLILNEDPAMMEAGDKFKEEGDDLNRRTFYGSTGGEDYRIILRVAEVSRDFCNHLYTSPEGEIGKAVVSYNRGTGAVTLSLAYPVPGVSCRAVAQKLWGPEAGGHDGIAGSPREKDMGLEGLQAAADALKALMAAYGS